MFKHPYKSIIYFINFQFYNATCKENVYKIHYRPLGEFIKNYIETFINISILGYFCSHRWYVIRNLFYEQS